MKSIRHILFCLMTALALLPSQTVKAFPTDAYAAKSALASGRWVKVSVSSTGIHFIPAATLRSWGFSNPLAVRIHGYGGRMLPDNLSASNYIDDLPQVQTETSSEGIYFYALGTDDWVRGSNGRYIRSTNPYSNAGYYFITESSAPQRTIGDTGTPGNKYDPVTTFTGRVCHETDQVTLSRSGRMLFGEDFRYTRSRTFNFTLPDNVGSSVWSNTSFVARQKAHGILTFTANGKSVGQATRVKDGDSEQTAGTRVTASFDFDCATPNVAFGITYTPSGNLSAAHLDAINLNWTRRIALTNGSLEFDVNFESVSIERAGANTRVWDVTDPQNILKVNAELSGSRLLWTADFSGRRQYMAWNPGASYPVPQMVGAMANQNLHGLTSTPDMVIITVSEWAGEAERLANMHRNDPVEPLTVEVVAQDPIFNEFSSGTRDVGAFRRFLKMIYDRGAAADRPLRYALLFGAPTFDNRRLTAEGKSVTTPVMPTWQSEESLLSSTSYTTDDIIAMIGDDNKNLGDSPLKIGVGRISARTLAQAKASVNKIIEYNDRSRNRGEWRTKAVIMADNAQGGTFMTGAENMYKHMRNGIDGNALSYEKVYVDAFTLEGGICVGGRKRLQRLLDNGIMFLSYIGHGAINTLADENLLSPHDIAHMYNSQYPMFFGATCSFSHWDDTEQCGTEQMFFNTKGGTIASIAPCRQSGISFNNTYAANLGKSIWQRDEKGRYPTLGDINMRTKNLMLTPSKNGAGEQKLMYVLLGDPALRLAIPDNRIVINTINGLAPDEEDQVILMGRQKVQITGSVIDIDSNPMTDFSGEVLMTLYDAEYSTTSLGQPDSKTDGAQITFDEQDGVLFMGRTKVNNGEFSLTFTMPAEVADNFRPAALISYAFSTDGRDASGACREFYVYGTDEDAAPDNNAPEIEYAYLNHESFTQGSKVNSSPMFIARVSDDNGINLSSAGIGHQMTLKLDDSRTFSDVSLYYTPSSDGSPSGTIEYPFDELPAGYHTLTLRVWDTSGNSTSRSIEFFVEPGLAPKLFDIYSDANPASTQANFYIKHNRPDAELTVTLEIYNMLGHRIWTTTVTDRSDMFLSAPITWNLCTASGARVIRGIYLYRATVRADGEEESTSEAKRIAVTGN